MHYLLMYDFNHDFVVKRPQFRGLHLEQIRQAYDSGLLTMAGALVEPIDVGVFVFRDSEAAEKFAKSDPYVTNGLIKKWRVRKWNTVIGDGMHTITL